MSRGLRYTIPSPHHQSVHITEYLSFGDGTRPAVPLAHSPADTCSGGGGDTGTRGGQEQCPVTTSAIPCAFASWTPISHLCVLAMPSSGFSQAVPGLTAPWRPSAIGTDHIVGTIPETTLDTVCLI